MASSRTLAVMFTLFLPALAWTQTVAPTPAGDEGFARFLFDHEEYTRAAGEYYRLLFTAAPGKQPPLLFEIGSCYEKAGDYRRALIAFERIIAEHRDSPLLEEAWYRAAYCSYRLGEYRAVAVQLERPAAGGPLSPRFLLLAGVASLLEDDWGRSIDTLDLYLAQPGAPAGAKVAELIALAREAVAPDGRSPFLAGLFSAIVPGSGKMYAGRWEDGFISLLLCGILGGLAAYQFVTDGVESVPAWIYTGLGGVFYLANIYGSVAAAERYGEGRLENIRNRVRAGVQIVLP